MTTTEVLANGVTRTTVTGTATYVGRGEFYTGLATGDAVTVETTSHVAADGTPHARVSTVVSKGGAWLAIHDLTEIV